MQQTTTSPSHSPHGTWFGHPRGLATLFFTEMWERFSYYGMRALLTLFMTTATIESNPGLGFDVATAGAIYGLYTSLVYILALPGGWVADNLWGQRKAVWVGGWIIALGHFTMAVPGNFTFFLGMVFIICGTGLLKPNVSTIVGELYPEGGARRDAGFSVFYMGINLGAFLGPIITGALGEGYQWHWGFGVAGIGMVAGLIQYKLGERHLGDAGLLKTGASPAEIASKSRTFFGTFFAIVAGIVAFGYLVSSGVIPLSLTQIASYLGGGVLILVALYFAYVLSMGGHSPEENKRIVVIFWLFLMIAVFWSGFEQAGTSLNLFARDFTDRSMDGSVMGTIVGAITRVFAAINPFTDEPGSLIPASTLQSINAFFIIILAPVFGSIWVWLERRNSDPSIPMKAGLGLLGLAMGFFVLSWGAANASADSLVSPSWLVVTYFLHTVGELCISPIGLSAVTKLSPQERVGQMMGIWFVGAALGNLIAGLVAGLGLEALAPTDLFRTVAMITGGVGVVAVVVSPWFRRMMGPRS